jgi:hypothetical protein
MRWFLVMLLPLILYGESLLQVGDQIVSRTLNDQFDTPHSIGKERIWVVTWDKLTTRTANGYFAAHPGMIRSGEAAMIVDISQTPGGILSLFVMPRMRSYDHPILMSSDVAFNRTIPYREGAITLLVFKSGKIARIGFASDDAALDAALRGATDSK